MSILEVKNLKKVYGTKGKIKTEALSNVNFSVEEGEFIAIMGESGSGKTTLLNIVATLDRATEGNVLIGGKDIGQLSNKEVANFRRNELGFVFQDFNLLDSFSNRDNIYLPLVLSGVKPRQLNERVGEIAPILGISKLLDKFPSEISGGQKQRVAIARAIITKPHLLLADEPTGALDSRSSETIMNLFCDINQKGQTVLMVTHSLRCAAYSKRVLFIKDGRVYHEIYRGDGTHQEFMEKINQAQIMLSHGGNYEK
ncbi:MAG: ABC transporter ATP-binding protein [Peptoniphilaceae bacterium]|uniref:ABC transporter ATP-binding protein n=1 Tax=Parvimonas sp. TaxID=1944660 RepID=UPI0025FB9259|nr:ABC transporter ATP-binding protein [Parvimonas sp.]MDD7764441.1 ABC transporter ATP-binding protein [Peptoniphilaceae bacterium]MDY3051158.1 ABC transporter ATP-binding protein [Parvimonas sp.]